LSASLTSFVLKMLPMESAGLLLVVMSMVFLISGAYFLVISVFESMRLPTFPVLDAIVDDSHYKYLVLLLIPTTSYFVIANWVGWQYFRNA